MARHRAHGRRCTFESLENRQLLAGNVTASINNGNLTVKGDNLDNQIQFSAAGITGLTGTTVNGSAAAFPLTGLTGRVKLDLKGGNDTVTGTITGPLTIKGFESKNIETLEALSATGNVTVNGNVKMEGVKALTMTNVTVNGKTEVEGTDGDDTLTVLDSTLNGKVDMDGGDGDDTLTIEHTLVNGNLDMDGGDGDNTLLLQCEYTDGETGDGSSDQCRVNGKLEMEGGDGDNSITIEDYTVTGKTEIGGGSGVDTVRISGSTFNSKTEVETGAGNDKVTVTDSTFTTVAIDLGKGDDTLIVTDTKVTTKTVLDGGPGTDTFTDGGGNTFLGVKKVKNFEVLLP
jgi:hypothetical protein